MLNLVHWPSDKNLAAIQTAYTKVKTLEEHKRWKPDKDTAGMIQSQLNH